MAKPKKRIRVEISLSDWEIIPILLYKTNAFSKYKSDKLYSWLCFKVTVNL